MGRLRLAWATLVIGLIASLAGIYLLAGIGWGLIGAGIELIALGVLIANLGDE